MLSQLNAKRNQLNSVSTKQPKQISKLLCEDSETYNKLMSETFIEEYYSEIEDYTFKSIFCSLSSKYAKAINDAYKKWSINKDINEIDNIIQENNILQELVSFIDKKTKNLQTTPKYFIRLSTRSPKDAVFYSSKFINIFNNEIDNIAKNNDIISDNDILVSMYKAMTVSMCNTSGIDAVRLLITSQRIQGDLETYAMNNNDSSDNNFQLVLRDWFDFKVSYEFRAFIYKGKITAFTQYNEYCFFNDLLEEKNHIENILQEQVLSILKNITKLSNLVLDLILCEENGKPIVKVVEINPLAEFAGTGLFSWEDDRDILLGNTDFEFRIQTKQPKNAIYNLPPTWLSIVEQVNQKYKEKRVLH